jgi:hypothetical protein
MYRASARRRRDSTRSEIAATGVLFGFSAFIIGNLSPLITKNIN